jgi:FxsC-like protein
MAYEFFLSYARLDDQRDKVQEFWRDLHQRVQEKTGISGDISYFDRDSNELGSQWANRIEEGLRTSKVFVLLISPSYLASEYCGKELTIFRRRVDAYVQGLPKGSRAPALILPLMWTRPLGKLPPFLAELQYDHADLPQSYRDEELSVLKENGRYKDDYRDVITHVAERIAVAMTEIPMPPAATVQSLASVPSAIHADRARSETPAGPNNACFVFVAATPAELEQLKRDEEQGKPNAVPAGPRLAIRSDSAAYGTNGGWWWRPFQPPDTEYSAGRIAQDVSGRLNLRYQEVEVNAGLIERVRKAAAQNNVIAVVVDACTLEHPMYREYMQQLDAWATAQYSVIVPWNRSDDTMTRFSDRLEALLKTAFPARTAFNNPTYFLRIQTLDDMRDKLASILTELRLKVIDNAAAAQLVESVKMPSVSNMPGSV